MRIGYAYASPIAPEELQRQLGALAAAQCGRIFADLVAASVKWRPQLDEALQLSRETIQAAPSQPVTITVTELDREHRRNKTLEAQQAAVSKGRRSGRPRALDEDMLALARTLRGQGVPVPEIAEELTVTTGKNAGRHPSVASVYRALAESEPKKLEGEGAATLADPALR